MASSKTEICNLALSHLGIAKEIANLDTENSAEANAMRRFYETARDEILRDFNWSFTTKFATLALIEEDPTTEWAYSYRYPSDCLKLRRILSGTRNDSRQTRVPYKIGQDNEGVLLYTDMQDAVIEYSVKIEETNLYPSDFTMALSYKLAFYAAPRLAAGDPFGLRNSAAQMFSMTMAKAAHTSLNEEQVEEDPQAEWIRARD